MSEADLMIAVWDDPNCPVTLAAHDAVYPWGPPIPYPRTQIEIPSGVNAWWLRCRCRGHGATLAVADEAEPVRPTKKPIVEMQPRVWIANEIGKERSVLVHLGQCGDCGRIYWGTNWGKP